MTQKQFLELCDFARIKMSNTKEPQHNWDHVRRVGENAIKIVELLGIKDKIDHKLLLSACNIHDLAISQHKPYKPSFFGSLVNNLFEGCLINRYLPKVLQNFNLDEKDREILLTAVRNHPLSFPYKHLNRNKDLYSKILQDADTLDMFSVERIKLFEENEKIYKSYKVAGYFKNPILSYGLRNLCKFLNFPELAQKFKSDW